MLLQLRQRQGRRPRRAGLATSALLPAQAMVHDSALRRFDYSGAASYLTTPALLMQVKAQEKVLPPNHSDSALVERIGRRIVSALPKDSTEARGYSRHLQAYTWEFVAVASDAVNAFVVPGGKVVVYTGAPQVQAALLSAVRRGTQYGPRGVRVQLVKRSSCAFHCMPWIS